MPSQQIKTAEDYRAWLASRQISIIATDQAALTCTIQSDRTGQTCSGVVLPGHAMFVNFS